MKLRLISSLISVPISIAISSTALAAGYEATIGVGVGIAPRYLGSDQYRAVPIPYLNLKTPVGIYLDTTRGVGYQFDLPHNFYIDGSINYSFGRKDTNESFASGSDVLRGMGNVPNAVVATVTAGYKFMGAGFVSVSGDIPVSNRRIGDSWRTALQVPLIITPTDVLATKVVAHIGSGSYNRTMWGVSQPQSVASGFRQYIPGGGINAVDFGLTWTHMFNRHWSLSTAGQLTRFVGDIGDSPIVMQRVSANVVAIVAYRF
ncbi:MipA/OmpV family protein [Burkholderia sp. BCC1972]|uniref:MipA/OmpV family protein n=1 Tax=Burkholderia sp. BCC1972 TaxID=2817438 RepID=UPI002ABD9AA0|nr:MipA/OmpV family protein [Burkholderia sp. BCC1972]